jgi:hypothetical protein
MIDSAIVARLKCPSAFRAFMASAVLCLTALLVSGSMKAVRAQSGCPPVDQAVAGWAQGTTVYYDINTLPPSIRIQLTDAFQKWTEANSSNGSGIKFAPADATHPPNFTVQAGRAMTSSGDSHPAITTMSPVTGNVTSAVTNIDVFNAGGNWYDTNRSDFETAMLKVMLHEIGHTMGIDDVPVPTPNDCGNQTARNSVMNSFCGVNDEGNNQPQDVTTCDNGSVSQVPSYTSGGGGGGNLCEPGPGGTCLADLTADQCWNTPACGSSSPVLIDVNGDGFALTDAAHGVAFDLNNDSSAEAIAWTAAGSDDSWLALDRNGNGHIDNGSELFGNFTWQYWSPTPNGFNALAWFDQIDHGGNGDGVIDNADPVFADLRLWQDSNHNGVSGAAELRSLPSLSIETLHFDYKESKKVDDYGNQFRYRAKVDDARPQKMGRWAWDVFLVKQ